MCVCVSLCTTVVHNTAQNSSDNFPYPPDNHDSSDDVSWIGWWTSVRSRTDNNCNAEHTSYTSDKITRIYRSMILTDFIVRKVMDCGAEVAATAVLLQQRCRRRRCRNVWVHPWRMQRCIDSHCGLRMLTSLAYAAHTCCTATAVGFNRQRAIQPCALCPITINPSSYFDLTPSHSVRKFSDSTAVRSH